MTTGSRRSRRSSADDGPTRTALLDAAEVLMVAEGYASVTTRRVAAAAGVNNGLVYYYFGTMDELFITLFRRAAARELEPLDTTQPLWRMWESMRDFSGNALMTEFIALANHRDAIRAEIAGYSERLRRGHIDALTRIFESHVDRLPDISPAAAAVLMVGVARFVQMEASFGVELGHQDAVDAIEARIRGLEGERRPA